MDKLEKLLEVTDQISAKYLVNNSHSLSENEKVIYSIWLLEADINNGGFNQYYFNSAGDFANEVVGSLRTIGAEECAKIVEEANANFGKNGPPVNRELRQNELEKLEDSGSLKLEGLDQKFYKYPNDLESLMYEFISKNEM